ncbi:hypothetical protein JG688_00000006 [Phytophthora aleatoria]|uniref:Uncharacterized protein n=1 Tax=Phytophthora aleatoria TaxID=2496075 RepID=A0A8J5J988_9STRA|nr:hypothetical protein JG688_00000006 [Phytophthora aleatoria]
MDADNLQNTLSNVLLYSFHEFVSLVVLAVFLRRTMEYSPVNQLAFVLRTQWKMVQSKLVLWVVYVVQSSLVHFGTHLKQAEQLLCDEADDTLDITLRCRLQFSICMAKS